MSRYITASSDLAVEVLEADEGGRIYGVDFALRSTAVSFCSDCGAIVYRKDLHDRWHDEHS